MEMHITIIIIIIIIIIIPIITFFEIFSAKKKLGNEVKYSQLI